ncbi:MAG: HAD family phosphatase [Planctomycetaceae bacterium]|nr:HAD family phosphatase [Planctomycetaceae bacterium]
MSDYAVIFDMDGVLVDSYQAHFESWRQMARRHGQDMTEPQFAATFGRTSRDIIHRLWGSVVTSAEQVTQWDHEKEHLYRQILAEKFPEMDGAHELIEALHAAGFVMAIGSSGPPGNVQVVRENLPGSRHINVTVTREDITHGKPDPEVFLKAADKLALPPCRCAVVEDAPAGIEAARRAGMAAIAITGTAPREELARGAGLVVDSLRELTPEIIKRLIERVAGVSPARGEGILPSQD